MKTVAIIPVKSFLKAKSRLTLSPDKTVDLCKLMLNEVLETISVSKNINRTIVVSHDQSAFDISKRFDVVEVFDESESGVNNAIELADKYISDSEFDTSLIIPQDIPFFISSDIDNLFSFFQNKSILSVPSRHFNGTNSLIRSHPNPMKTRYDEGTYKSHLQQAKSDGISFSIVLIRRIMLDIDTQDDIEFAMKHKEKLNVCKKMLDLLS